MREQSQTRKDLEVAARRLVGDTSQMSGDAADAAKKVGPALGIIAALLAFAWGRRRGRKRSAYIEVRRAR